MNIVANEDGANGLMIVTKPQQYKSPPVGKHSGFLGSSEPTPAHIETRHSLGGTVI